MPDTATLYPKPGPVHRGRFVDKIESSENDRLVWGWSEKYTCASDDDAVYHSRIVDFVLSNHLGPESLFSIYGILRECHKGEFDTYEEEGCFPTTGVSNIIDVFLCNVNNCLSAHRQRVELTYSAGSGTWTGSIDLVNGTLTFELECGVPSAGFWRLTLAGCLLTPIVLDAEPDPCNGLLLLSYFDQNIDPCCTCEGGTDSSIIGISVASRRPTNYIGRYIDEVTDKKVFGYKEECNDGCVTVNCCDNIQCDITVELSGCAGIAGVYTLTPQPAEFGYDQEWDWQGPAPCDETETLSIFLGCTEGPTGCGNFTIVIVCNAYTDGTSSAVRDCCDEDGLVDVTIPVTLVYHSDVPGATPCCDPTPCSGTVTAHVTL